MPIYVNKESLKFWKDLGKFERSRTLAASRFVTIAEDQDGKKDTAWRKTSCLAIKDGVTLKEKTAIQKSFAARLAGQGGEIIFAKLEARLIINAAGGVLENGGLSLDRISGIPFIPGSATKGAARRFAIYELSQENDAYKKADLLYQLCLVFGYGDQEWKKGRDENKGHSRSDFWLAMQPLDAGKKADVLRDKNWDSVAAKVALRLFAKFASKPKKEDQSAYSQLPNFAGSICFLAAFPESDPCLDIDVLTCHHPEYYAGNRDFATDDENPNPVLFPTVAAGAIFQFPLLPTMRANEGDLEAAANYLTQALQVFGLGAKTNAGYGWFSIDEKAKDKFEGEKLVRSLKSEFINFDDWLDDRKENAILELSERIEDCKTWSNLDIVSFSSIRDYAETQGINLI